MTEKVADYERLLRDLSLRATDNDAKLIKESLEKVGFSFIPQRDSC